MCAGVALRRSRFTDEFIAANRLESRIIPSEDEDDGGEVRFSFRDPKALLPVWWDGELTIIEWGNRDDKTSRLPRTGWCRSESLAGGKWSYLHPEEVTILASLGLEKGVWFQIKDGMKGIVVNDEKRMPHVYMLTEPASHNYEIMTGHNRMPVLIDQRI